MLIHTVFFTKLKYSIQIHNNVLTKCYICDRLYTNKQDIKEQEVIKMVIEVIFLSQGLCRLSR